MRFDFAVSSDVEVAALAFVSGHGATDVDVDRFWMTYAGVAMLPKAAVTPLFVLLSLAHFSSDIGLVCALCLHWTALLVSLAFGKQRGAQLIFIYLVVAHTPLHYAHAVQRGRALGLLSSLVVTVAVFLRLKGANSVCLGEWRQRAIVAHILNEALSGI